MNFLKVKNFILGFERQKSNIIVFLKYNTNYESALQETRVTNRITFHSKNNSCNFIIEFAGGLNNKKNIFGKFR